MTTTSSVETFSFQAETAHLLRLMIHSLYTNREIFLRELISNASDALDRLRLESLKDPRLLPTDHIYEIRLIPDPAGRTLTIRDSGIGMTREELIQNIGTIARSGTQEVRTIMTEPQSAEVLADLIGQFGVGFYSAFMVADTVSIISRHAMSSAATSWTSNGDGTYTVSDAEKIGCGTDVILHLKPKDIEGGIEDYANRWTLTMAVHKYSDFISYPIVYEGPAQEPGEAKETDTAANAGIKVLNSMKPIWARVRAEVTESEYNEFYKRLSNDWIDPMKILPLRAEGASEYKALLFIPGHAPYDLFYHGAETGLRLYAKRVMVMEQCPDLLPKYLRFIKGVVDSSDLPLNISRQRLQQDRQIAQIRKWLTRKVLDLVGEMRDKDHDDYLKFWSEFGRALKEGVTSDYEHKDRLLRLLMFESSHDAEKLTSLSSYVQRMPPEQKNILYLTGLSRSLIEHSPHLEVWKQKGYEVLYLSDPVDELLVQHLQDFEGKLLKSVAKGMIDLGSSDEAKQSEEDLKKKEQEYEQFLKAMQKRLDPYVRQVKLSARLVQSPACLVTADHEYSPNLERLLQKGKGAGPKQRRIMELNSSHPIVDQLHQNFVSNAEDEGIGEIIEVLFELALMNEGSEMSDPVRFNNLTLAVVQRAMQCMDGDPRGGKSLCQSS